MMRYWSDKDVGQRARRVSNDSEFGPLSKSGMLRKTRWEIPATEGEGNQKGM